MKLTLAFTYVALTVEKELPTVSSQLFLMAKLQDRNGPDLNTFAFARRQTGLSMQ